jgi:peptidyl-prolyl cis-trans isomerase SurA
MKMTVLRTTVALVAFATVATSLLAQSPVPAPPAAATSAAAPKTMFVERVLVRVNGEIFTQSQLTNRQIETLQEMQRGPEKLDASIAEVTPRLLVEAVEELLLVQRGRELGVRFSDEQFKTAVDNIKRDNKLDDAGLKAGLAQAGLTLDLLRERLEKQYLVNAVQSREIGPSLTITVEEMRQFYEKNKATFMTPLTVTLRELMVAVPTITVSGKETFSAADDAAAKEKIEGLRARAIAGTPFTTLISEASDSTTKATGGLIGPINAEDLNAALKDGLTLLPAGGVTVAFRAPRGYQIFQLENRSSPAQRPFDSVRGQIEQTLREQRILPETEKLLTRLRAQAVIEWKDESFKKIYEQAVATQAAK